MKSWLAFSTLVALSALVGCSSPDRNRATSPTGGNTSTGGSQASGGSSDGSGGVGSGGSESSGVSTGQGGSVGSGGNTSVVTTAKGGSGGSVVAGGNAGSSGGVSGGNNPGGTTAKGSSGASAVAGGSAGSSGGSNPGGAKAGSSGSVVSGGAGSGSGGTTGSSSGTAISTGPNPTGPCDIYKAGGTPCGAAHSMVRALLASYTGPLYQVQRASDKTTKDIMVGTDGFVKSSDQDSFCSGTTCTIPIIYDQSGNENHLRVTFWAYWLMSGGNPATANAAKATVGGHTVYGIRNGNNVAYHSGVMLSGTASVTKGSSTVTFSTPQTLPANSILQFVDNTKDCPMGSYPNNCYYKRNFTAAAITNATTVTLTANYVGSSYPATRVHNGTTKGIAIDDQAEAEYAIFDGKVFGTLCCFDYGAAEMTGFDEGNATMEAISWGATTQFGQSGGGSGPWIAADIENGMYEGYENGSAKVPSNTSITGWPYVTAMLKGLSAKDCPAGLTSSGCFALKAGNSQTGKLEWKWNANTKNYGARPPGYSPQKKQGAVILGTGGDGSNTGVGIWFEGAMTMGASSDATDDAVQANIVAAGFGK
jgi:non-reducing end alpha-L-arabinofuranosidase